MITITSKAGSVFSLEKDEFEIVKASVTSIAKGRCFLLINKSGHSHELDLAEYNRVNSILDPDDVDKWEESKRKIK